MKAKTWWRNNADEWLKKTEHFSNLSKGNSKNYLREEMFLIDQIKNSNFKTILEVGAGNGRIICKLSELFDCSSCDINPELSAYVKKSYPLVKTYVSDIIELPFKDKEFDLVYTHEVLQHVDPKDIDKAVSELKRVGKEIWCMENWRDNQLNSEKVSDSHCGRWNYDLKKYFDTYYDFYTDWGQLFIKSKII